MVDAGLFDDLMNGGPGRAVVDWRERVLAGDGQAVLERGLQTELTGHR